ncbi:hypothetical protein Tsubulata_014129 [Turnera subulata]|uniref:Uncharacterized protein n=1 Tax=Turnera subulata TaxID=218843 RepID=A0A9Q0JSV5_9ROSI|nr:hypothetical protein Tsubulata_014129 [Turnera subulata]
MSAQRWAAVQSAKRSRREESKPKGRRAAELGATYEGEFRSGRMDGQGTFIGVDGESYSGQWSADRKHGFSEKRYANGDVYRGGWKCNVQDGEGMYVWQNGNEYVGQWKGRFIHDKGVLVWSNGNCYEGFWENGVPKGKGLFTFGPPTNATNLPNANCNYSNYIRNFNRDEPEEEEQQGAVGLLGYGAARKRSSVDVILSTMWIV